MVAESPWVSAKCTLDVSNTNPNPHPGKKKYKPSLPWLRNTKSLREVVSAAVGMRELKRSETKKREERKWSTAISKRGNEKREPKRGLKLPPLQPPKPKLSPSLSYHHI